MGKAYHIPVFTDGCSYACYYEEDIVSFLQLFIKMIFFGYPTRGHQNRIHARGYSQPFPCFRFPPPCFSADRQHGNVRSTLSAYRFRLYVKIRFFENRFKITDMTPHLRYFINPVPGEVFHQHGGYDSFFCSRNTDCGNIANHE